MADVPVSAFEMFSMFEITPDLVCIAGKDGYFRKVNPAVVVKLGYTQAELYARPVSAFIHPEDRVNTQQGRTQLLDGKPLLNFQNRYVRKDGSIIWLEWTSIYLSDKEIVFAIAKDITARKEAEQEIEEKYRKFKSLATHFKTSIEKERKYLAVELHEELAQLAAVVKLDINWINNNEPALSGMSKARIAHATLVADLLVTTIRRITFSLSPKMLNDLGLKETLLWHCNEFAALNGIPCVVESAFEEAVLTPEMKLDFFRICQEALNNIMDHAHAGQVKICIEDRGNNIMLRIEYNGIGFNLWQQQQTPGLTNMRELAASINADLTIDTAPGKGTVIEVILKR